MQQEFKKGDQVIVDNFVEQSNKTKLLKSQVCLVLVAGKFDLIVQSDESTYYPKVFPVSKQVCRRIFKKNKRAQVETTKPRINDLVAGITSDLSSKKQEIHVGVLEEIIHNNTSSKSAVLRAGIKRTTVSFGNLVILEQNNNE